MLLILEFLKNMTDRSEEVEFFLRAPKFSSIFSLYTTLQFLPWILRWWYYNNTLRSISHFVIKNPTSRYIQCGNWARGSDHKHLLCYPWSATLKHRAFVRVGTLWGIVLKIIASLHCKFLVRTRIIFVGKFLSLADPQKQSFCILGITFEARIYLVRMNFSRPFINIWGKNPFVAWWVLL